MPLSPTQGGVRSLTDGRDATGLGADDVVRRQLLCGGLLESCVGGDVVLVHQELWHLWW